MSSNVKDCQELEMMYMPATIIKMENNLIMKVDFTI